jgi:hypothetical protein
MDGFFTAPYGVRRDNSQDGPFGLLSWVRTCATVNAGMRTLLALWFICVCVTVVACLALGGAG